MKPSTSFLTTYTAIRFTTGKKAPGIVWPLMKAFAIICYIMMSLPIHLALLVRKRALAANAAAQHPPRPVTANGYPRNFQDHIDDLQEEMK